MSDLGYLSNMLNGLAGTQNDAYLQNQYAATSLAQMQRGLTNAAQANVAERQPSEVLLLIESGKCLH